MKKAMAMPPTPTKAKRSLSAGVGASGEICGRIIQYTSTAWAMSSQMAMAASLRLSNLSDFDSRMMNGSTKCPTTRNQPTYFQSLQRRMWNHGVSSGMSAIQMSMNWQKAVYAQKQLKANS